MIVKKLNNPAKITREQIQELQDEILKYLVKTIYKPIIQKIPEMNLNNVKNAKNPAGKESLLSAFRDGRLVFYRGEVRGNLNSVLSRELKELGARWDSKTGTWRISLASLPQSIISAINVAESSYSAISSSVMDEINKIVHDSNGAKLKWQKFYDMATLNLDKKFSKQLEGITVAPQLTKDELFKISKNYSENLDLYIKDFTNEQIISLRKKVQFNFYSGNRNKNLIETIKESYGTSHAKAKFLARQETNLLSSEYQRARCVSAGSVGYEWVCVKGTPKHPVRPDHKKLDGKEIDWDFPPVVDLKTNRHAHAGEDFGCRCYKRIIFKFK